LIRILQWVLNPKKQRTTYITPLDVKLGMLEEQGIDYCFIINFSSNFASLSPDYFVKEYIIGSKIKALIAGFDFTYGFKGQGNIETLSNYDEFTVSTVDKCVDSEDKVSTTKIRKDLSEGID
jgi:riboflavin kinase/FMN adenylyltransferase